MLLVVVVVVVFCLYAAKPSITTFPQSATIIEGENVTLQCNATGGPLLNISWSFKGSVIMTNAGFGNILPLKLVNVNRNAGGDYRCDVRSRVGINTSTSTLNVYCKYIYLIIPFWCVVLLNRFTSFVVF